MAILKGIRASVAINGESLVEYDEDVNEISDNPRDSNLIVKYVEAISGAHFEIRYRWDIPDLKTCEGLMFQADLDGKCMDSVVYQFKKNHSHGRMDSARRCVCGQWTREKFRFAEIISGINWILDLVTTCKADRSY